MKRGGQLGQGTSKTTDARPKVSSSIIVNLAQEIGQLIVGKGARDKNEPF